MYGRISNGDSLIPRNIFAAHVTLSHTVVPSNDCRIHPSFSTTNCIAPQ